jgi:hypothetical protein
MVFAAADYLRSILRNRQAADLVGVPLETGEFKPTTDFPYLEPLIRGRGDEAQPIG